MLKKVISIILLAAMTAVLFAACASKKDKQESARLYADYIDSGKTFAAQIGDVYGAVANDIFKAKQIQEFTFAPDMLEAVRMDKVDAAILDDAYVKQIRDSGEYPDLDYLSVPKEVFVNMASNVFYTEGLRDQFNEWFEIIEKDGTFDEIYSRWIGVSLPDEKDIPRFELTGENGTLTVCNTGSFPPFSYADSNNRPVGFDEEIISRFAAHMGMDIEYNMMSYDAIVPFVLSGKADMSACSFTVTDDRSDNVIFGKPYTKAKAVLVVKKSGADVSARDYTYFEGKDIAVRTGVLTYDTTKLIGGNPINYNDSSSAAEDVRKGRVEGYMHALTEVQVMASQMEGFEAIPVPKEIFFAQVAGISDDQAVIDRFNQFLAVVEKDGTLAKMQNRWFGEGFDLDAPIPEISNSGKNGTVKVAICSDSIPYVLVGANGQYSGFSVELALRFGAYEGKKVEFADMEFGGLIPYVVSGKAEIGLANIAISEERKKMVLFTESFFDEQHGILTLKQEDKESGTRNYTEFFGEKLGIPTGYVLDTMIKEDFSGTVAFYSETSAGIEDVRQGRIAGFMTDLSVAHVIVNQSGNDDLVAVAVTEKLFSGPLGAISSDEDMIKRFNAFLEKIKADGTLANMQRYWIDDNPGSDPPMPDIANTGTKGVLKVAIGSGSVPFCYIGANGEIKGCCAELMLRFAAHEGLTVEFTTMEFSTLIQYIASGKAEIGIDAITITEERKEKVLFTEPFYYDSIGIVALKQSDNKDTGSGGFIEWIKTGIQKNLIADNRWKLIVNGLLVTMLIAVLAQLFGTAFGCFICWLLTRRNRSVRWLGGFYCGLIHGTPIVVLLMITYYIIFTDSMLCATGADFAFMTGGNIRASINAGDITAGEVLTTLPYSNLLATVELTGADILKILEHGVEMYPEPVGHYIHVSGLSFTFDSEAEGGNRVRNVEMADGNALVPNQRYTVATIDFIAAGGDGYDMMANGTNLKYYGGDAEALIAYLETEPVINAEAEGRVREAAGNDLAGEIESPKTGDNYRIMYFVFIGIIILDTILVIVLRKANRKTTNIS